MQGALLFVSHVKILNERTIEATVAALTLGYAFNGATLLRTFTIVSEDPIKISITNDMVEEYCFMKLNIPQDMLDMLTSSDKETAVMAGDLFSIYYETYIPKDYQDAVARTDVAQRSI